MRQLRNLSAQRLRELLAYIYDVLDETGACYCGDTPIPPCSICEWVEEIDTCHEQDK